MLPLRVQATAAEDLEQINCEVHDWFFDVDDVRFDAHRSEVTVPFRRWSTDEARIVETTTRSRFQRLLRKGGRTEWEAPSYRWMLRIGDATRCELVDSAEIGSADFYGLEFDAGVGVVTIEGNIPVTISVRVQRLNVTVEETDEVIGLARYTTRPGGADSYTGMDSACTWRRSRPRWQAQARELPGRDRWDVRQEYWNDIRGEPKRSHERVVHG